MLLLYCYYYLIWPFIVSAISWDMPYIISFFFLFLHFTFVKITFYYCNLLFVKIMYIVKATQTIKQWTSSFSQWDHIKFSHESIHGYTLQKYMSIEWYDTVYYMSYNLCGCWIGQGCIYIISHSLVINQIEGEKNNGHDLLNQGNNLLAYIMHTI